MCVSSIKKEWKYMKSYDLLFQTPFNKSQELDDTFINLVHNEGIDAGIDYLKKMGAESLDMINYSIEYQLNQFTYNIYTQEEKEAKIKKLLDFKDYIKNIEIITDDKIQFPKVIIETTEGNIKIRPFSSINSQIKEVIPFIDTPERLGKCYELAYTICLNLGIPNNIVTGYIYGYTDKSRFLHSWVETTWHNEEIVIDGTRNIIMNKDGYYRMKHAKALTKISDETLKDDVRRYLSKVGKVKLDVYYLFRDEIIRDFQKNEIIFNPKKH